MEPVAIIGAAGFVGTRLVESCLLSGIKDFYPIIRNNYSLARLCRFGHQDRIRIADAENENQLVEAINHSPIVVNLVSGDPDGIVNSTKVIHNACVKSGVRRLIHLSSAVVYDQVESPMINDDSPLEVNHWMPYAQAKIEAENYLKKYSEQSSLETIILRPGIVWGPRSRWSYNAAKALTENNVFIVGSGKGICNTIYIDNLVASILVCCNQEEEISGSFNVADAELITWYDFYSSLSDFLNYDMTQIPTINDDQYKPSVNSIILDIKSSSIYNNIKKSITPENRKMIKQFIASIQPPHDQLQIIETGQPKKPFVSKEMWNLQKTSHKLPTTKFSERFNFTSPVSFKEGVEMTINWLKFLGF
jgi:2-alkyl-3-oxoalkanoate reductase